MQQQHGFDLVSDGDLPHDCAQVAEGLPPGEALRQLLRGYDFVLHYGASDQAADSELRRVWIFRTDGEQSVRMTLSTPEELPGSREGLRSIDPEQRAVALHGLASTDSPPVEDAVAAALEDTDENVRHQALVAAQANGTTVAPARLQSLLSADPSDVVRAFALEAFLLNPDIDQATVSAVLDSALVDPSFLVRDRAAAAISARTSPLPSSDTSSAGNADSTYGDQAFPVPGSGLPLDPTEDALGPETPAADGN